MPSSIKALATSKNNSAMTADQHDSNLTQRLQGQVGTALFQYDIKTLIKSSKTKTCETSLPNSDKDDEILLLNKSKLSQIVGGQNQRCANSV